MAWFDQKRSWPMSIFIIIKTRKVDATPCILSLKLGATLVTKKSSIIFKFSNQVSCDQTKNVMQKNASEGVNIK